MSVKIVKEFFKKVAADKELQTKIQKIDNEFKEAYREAYSNSLSKLAKIGAEEGFTFKPQAIVNARNEKIQPDDNNDGQRSSGLRYCTEGLYAWDPDSEDPTPPTTPTPPVDPPPEDPGPPAECYLLWSW
jgi:hypothetical protein